VGSLGPHGRLKFLSARLPPIPPEVYGLPSIGLKIVAQASNYEAPTTVRCRRRPRRRPCGALLTLFFDTDTFDVLWFCPACDDNGRISGWEGTFWDNSDIGEVTT
jgi:hypothetical protein